MRLPKLVRAVLLARNVDDFHLRECAKLQDERGSRRTAKILLALRGLAGRGVLQERARG